MLLELNTALVPFAARLTFEFPPRSVPLYVRTQCIFGHEFLSTKMTDKLALLPVPPFVDFQCLLFKETFVTH